MPLEFLIILCLQFTACLLKHIKLIIFSVHYGFLDVSQLELGLNFLNEPRDTVGIKGKPLSLSCLPMLMSSTDWFEVTWYQNNQVMDLRNDKRRTIFRNGTLHFFKVGV